MRYKEDTRIIGLCCAIDARYSEKEDFWFFLGRDGSQIAFQNDYFIVMKPENIPHLAVDAMFCDECVATLCTDGSVKFVGNNECTADREWYEKARSAVHWSKCFEDRHFISLTFQFRVFCLFLLNGFLNYSVQHIEKFN